jgi:hypothetical protein
LVVEVGQDLEIVKIKLELEQQLMKTGKTLEWGSGKHQMIEGASDE